jgi:hypothetical protein
MKNEVFYRQIVLVFRDFRLVKAKRILLKEILTGNVFPEKTLANAQDGMLTSLANNLILVKETDKQAISAIILGGMIYLTLLAHNDRSMVGLDLRNEENWERIENALEVILLALNGVDT